MMLGSKNPLVFPEPEPPTTSTFRLRSKRRSWSGRSIAIPKCFVRTMFLSGSSRFMNRLPSRTVPQRALPCSSPCRSGFPCVSDHAQAHHTAQAATSPVASAAASSEEGAVA